MAIKKTTIFRQLIYNIVIPVILALFSLALLNLLNIYSGLRMYNSTKKNLIQEQVKGLLEYQDITLNIVDNNLTNHVVKSAQKIISDYNKSPNLLLNVNLNSYKQKLNFDAKNEDIYFINTSSGIIENTSFRPDSGKNVYNFGKKFKNFLLKVKNSHKLYSERFTLEMSTGRVRKYAYIATADKKYIIEIGFYSAMADSVLKLTRERLLALQKTSKIAKIDLYIGADQPFSILTSAVLPQLSVERNELMRVFTAKSNLVFVSKEAKDEFRYQYLYLKRKNTTLYPSAVIMIKSSTRYEKQMYFYEILKFAIVFGITLLLVIWIIYKKTRVITTPIKKLVSNVNKIRELHLTSRAEIIGNNEITRLSEHFNLMLEQLEEYYNELEDKVRQRTAELKKQKDEIERQQNAIMDSIQYARRIQTAILPSKEYVNSLLSDSFILYRPKDVVSGDFYWFSEVGKYIFAAAVDCTGHGVPGAFMSIVGNSQLDYTINIAKNLQPDEILNILNKRVADTVKHSTTDQNDIPVKDGMDMVLCRLDLEKNELQASCANNPIYIIRKNELIELKPTRLAIGAYYDRPGRKFDNHIFKLQKGDTIYLFSDGYVDQFGGPKNRKFLKKNFRKLLLGISDKEMSEQKEILDLTIDGWRQDYSQIDDIMVLGIRI